MERREEKRRGEKREEKRRGEKRERRERERRGGAGAGADDGRSEMDSLNWLDWINAETFPADEEEDPTDVDFDEDLNLEAVDLEGLLGATRGHYKDEDEDEEEEGEGEGAIATRTRRHVQLEDTAIEELERPLRVGDWDEGGREYRHYIHFLSSLEVIFLFSRQPPPFLCDREASNISHFDILTL